MRIHTYWTKKIFKEARWVTPLSAFRFLENLPSEVFIGNNLISKEEFFANLSNLVESIELSGDTLKDSREMLAVGSIGENWFFGEYGELRKDYIQQRKKLKKQLKLINFLFR